MATPIHASKQALRQQVSALVKAIPVARRAEVSAQACALLKQQLLWKSARSILFFAPLPGELDVWPLLREALAEGRTVALPRFDAAAQAYRACPIRDLTRDLHSGLFGIREPKAHCVGEVLNCLDLILVPGVAFDLHGRRLGRGRGFYDQLLTTVSGSTCGVAFDEQLVPEIPVEPHDRHLNCILTPTRWLSL